MERGIIRRAENAAQFNGDGTPGGEAPVVRLSGFLSGHFLFSRVSPAITYKLPVAQTDRGRHIRVTSRLPQRACPRATGRALREAACEEG